MRKSLDSLLILANGSVYPGRSFGAPIAKGDLHYGEICFNTSMTGYQEILTDPSYRRQIVVMTQPMIGNYGTTEKDMESDRIQASGFIVKNYVDPIWQKDPKKKSLAQFLQDFDVPALEGIDTRKLVLEIRKQGVQQAQIIAGLDNTNGVLHKLQSAQPIPIEEINLVAEVTTPIPYVWNPDDPHQYSIAVLDTGIKKSILVYLAQAGFRVHVFPAYTTFSEIEKTKCHAYFLSNGPGDPAQMTSLLGTVSSMRKSGLPIFGICLGHQLLALADGFHSYKLKFGHRGGNQPVQDQESRKIEITSQNHGYAIARTKEMQEPTPSSSHTKQSTLKLQGINLNDHSVESFATEPESLKDPPSLRKSGPVLCTQYHPEGAPGPHDAKHLFLDFFRIVDQYYKSHSNKIG